MEKTPQEVLPNVNSYDLVARYLSATPTENIPSEVAAWLISSEDPRIRELYHQATLEDALKIVEASIKSIRHQER